MKNLFKRIKRLVPQIKKAKVYTGDYERFIGKMEIWRRGNSSSYVAPRIIQVGFSGSNKDPFSTLHIYLWTLDIVWWYNPIKWAIDAWNQFKNDREAKREGERCPKCNSWKISESEGFAGEPIVFCRKCGELLWEPEDITPYII